MIFNFLKYLFLIKGLTIYILFEFVSIPQIKSSEIIRNEENINLNSFISYARKSHTDNFILVDKNWKAYKSCLAEMNFLTSLGLILDLKHELNTNKTHFSKKK